MFSTFGIVHSKLSGARKLKLVYVKINGKQLSTQAFDDFVDDSEFNATPGNPAMHTVLLRFIDSKYMNQKHPFENLD